MPPSRILSMEDAKFLEWVAGWIDTIDPVLRMVYGEEGIRIGTTGLTDEERARIKAWLEGREVQERLLEIASRASNSEAGNTN